MLLVWPHCCPYILCFRVSCTDQNYFAASISCAENAAGLEGQRGLLKYAFLQLSASAIVGMSAATSYTFTYQQYFFLKNAGQNLSDASAFCSQCT